MTTQQNHIKRVAINRLITPKGIISPAVVELSDGKIVGYFKLEKELPFTEWRGGEMVLTDEK